MPAYSFQDVEATLSGPTGDADLGFGASIAKEGITIVRSRDTNTMDIGADGGGQHSLHADKSGHVTIRTLKTSPLNSTLQTMYDAQRASASLWGQNVIVVSETESGDVTTCQEVAFKKDADLTYADEAGIMEWGFDAILIDKVLGTF
jgi:predicted SPOUT superfamily RNA methylase MTH1